MFFCYNQIMTEKFIIKTFGCQMNKHDSGRLAGLLSENGYQETLDLNEAKIVIFNSCCVREHADDRLYGNVAALKEFKEGKPELVLAVGGCLAQRDGQTLQERLPHVDIVFGTDNHTRLPQLIQAARQGRKICDTSTNGPAISSIKAKKNHDYHAWVQIISGCNNYCSYCIVPYVRGPEKSRNLEEITAEVTTLVSEGVIEVTLLGQNVNSYGRDLYGEPKFATLLQSVADIPGLRRLRFTTSHPKDLNDEVIDVVGTRKNICPHFHLPVQAGANRILKSMRRRYTREQFLELAAKIREKIAGVSLTTDVMIGFPGETEEDFQDTLALFSQVKFDQAFTFIYSKRQGTRAALMPDQVPHKIKKERFQRLLDLQNSICLANNEALIGNNFELYVEGVSKKGRYNLKGRTQTNKLVHFIGDEDLINSFVEVKIVKAFSWFLIGKKVK